MERLIRIPKVNACTLISPQVNPDSQNDFGSYNCTASNEIGTESKEFILIQAGPSVLCDMTFTYNFCVFPRGSLSSYKLFHHLFQSILLFWHLSASVVSFE